jgi:hypothetical protein
VDRTEDVKKGQIINIKTFMYLSAKQIKTFNRKTNMRREKQRV